MLVGSAGQLMEKKSCDLYGQKGKALALMRFRREASLAIRGAQK